MTRPTLRGTTHADLLGIPAVLLGFHPQDSCVAIAIAGGLVEFCARFELDWFVAGFDDAARQLDNACARVGACRFVLVGYGDPDDAAVSVTQLAALLGHHRVLDSLITDGEAYWCLGCASEPVRYRFEESALAAQAVYEGIRVMADRDEALAPVTRRRPASSEQVASARYWASRLPDERYAAALRRLVESEEPLDARAALRLAVLVADDDAMAMVLTTMHRDNAEAMWRNLAEARAVAPADASANVVALLGAASWRSGRGAALTECLEQLARIDPQHVVGSLLHRLQRDGIPPSWWDE